MAKPQRESRNPGIPFDPLQYVKRLEAVGFTRAQAEEQAETFLAIVQEQLVTKQDLKELEAKTTLESELIRRDIKELEVKMTQQIKELEVKVTQQVKELETNSKNQIELLRRDLKIWFGGMLVTLVVAISGILAIIPHLSGHS